MYLLCESGFIEVLNTVNMTSNVFPMPVLSGVKAMKGKGKRSRNVAVVGDVLYMAGNFSFQENSIKYLNMAKYNLSAHQWMYMEGVPGVVSMIEHVNESICIEIMENKCTSARIFQENATFLNNVGQEQKVHSVKPTKMRHIFFGFTE